MIYIYLEDNVFFGYFIVIIIIIIIIFGIQLDTSRVSGQQSFSCAMYYYKSLCISISIHENEKYLNYLSIYLIYSFTALLLLALRYTIRLTSEKKKVTRKPKMCFDWYLKLLQVSDFLK